MSTFMANKGNIERKWYVIDAAGKPMGKTAVAAADLLRICSNADEARRYFTVVGDVITQHVDTSTAEFPVISDPSIWTVAECIGSVALILGFAAAKMTTLIAKIGKIIKASSSLISKWKAAIGSANFTVAEFKTFINLMHGYLEKTLSAAQRVKVNTLLNAIGNTLVTIIGLEACWNWYKNG